MSFVQYAGWTVLTNKDALDMSRTDVDGEWR